MSETPVSRPIDQAAAIDQANILMQALPHMLHYDETIIVVKYGGHAMGDESVARNFARDMVLLEQSGVNPVVVHGGGPQIGAMLDKLGIKSEFVDGLRVTDKADRRSGRNGAGRRDQQADRRLHQFGGRPRHRPVRQGRHGHREKAARPSRTASRRSISALSANPTRWIRPCWSRCSAAIDPGARPDRARRGGRDLQRQRRHLRRRHRGGAERQAPAAAHRRAGRDRQGQD